MEEIWKPIAGTNNQYEVSNTGKIRSTFAINKLCKVITHRYRVMKPTLSEDGYLKIFIKGRHTCVHRLVAETFIPNPNNLEQVNHIDENRLNNNVSNLEWCSASYNNRHGIRGMKISESTIKRIGIKYDVFLEDGTFFKRYDCALDIVEDLGVCEVTIRKYSKTGKPFKGYVFKRLSDICEQPKGCQVIKRDKQGNIVRVFKSILEASREDNLGKRLKKARERMKMSHECNGYIYEFTKQPSCLCIK